jgi:hypothetical protein
MSQSVPAVSIDDRRSTRSASGGLGMKHLKGCRQAWQTRRQARGIQIESESLFSSFLSPLSPPCPRPVPGLLSPSHLGECSFESIT